MSDVIGVDIGSYTIKMVGTRNKGDKTEVVFYASDFNPIGTILPTDKAGEARLVETLKKMAVEKRLVGKKINLALPETLAYTAIVSMPVLSDAELASSINWEAEQHIPVPLKDINLEWSILYKPPKQHLGEKMRVLLVGARKEVVNAMVNVVTGAGLEIVGLETGMLAIQRGLQPIVTQNESVMVCHLGAMATEVLIVHNGEMVLTYSTQIGGLAFTRGIERGLGLQPRQAEEYKRAYGMEASHLDGKVRQVLMPVVNVLVSELRKAIQFYQATHTASPIRMIALSGGSAYMPGLTTFLAETFGVEVVMANPIDGNHLTSTSKEPVDIAAYTIAIGLAVQE